MEALWWGCLAGGSLILGGAAALMRPIPQRLLGLIMAFGAGVLISAVAFELVEEALGTTRGVGITAAGLFTGSAVFFIGDSFIDRRGGLGRKSSAVCKQTDPGWLSCSARCWTEYLNRWC